MTQEIDNHISVINDTLKWAKDFHKDSFPVETFKEYRRRLVKIRDAVSSKCSAAAYGESQVGKSYLMSSLLSSAEYPFVIENDGRSYSFINDINPSGGNTQKIETTGIITRFTIQADPHKQQGRVKVRNLSVTDIILLLTDSYYNDVRLNADTPLPYDVINRELEKLSYLWEDKTVRHEILSEDDIKDIEEYVRKVIGNSAAPVYQSTFARTIAPVIRYIPVERWKDVFGLLWNQNEELNRLFDTLISAYSRIDFRQEVYVPFQAVLRNKGTLLRIGWLDAVFGLDENTENFETTTDVYDINGQLLTSGLSKGELSAIISEIVFDVPESLADDRKFLKDMDLLDFPGARSRENYKESDIATVLPQMLRRGKVAYLFNKYSQKYQIASVLFCHHNDQKTEPTLGEAINTWLEDNIGMTPEERASMIRNTGGISPLFLIATKFNIELERTLNDHNDNLDTLDKHWDRFTTVLPEIIKPDKWLDEWITRPGGTTVPFRNIYPLRDFYWSAKRNVFDGYDYLETNPKETGVHPIPDFPDYMDRLRDSFLRNNFVRRHFEDPEQTWNDFATVNNDGSKAIIHNLGLIARLLESARREKFQTEIDKIKRDMLGTLEVYFEPEDKQAKNDKVRAIARDIRSSLMQTVTKNPTLFGQTLDSLMVSPEAIRNIAYDIIVRHIDQPESFNDISFIRAMAGIDPGDNRDENIRKLLAYNYVDTEDELEDLYAKQGLTLEQIISGSTHILSTMGDVIVKHITDYWIDHLNTAAQNIVDVLPHADEVVFMLVSLFRKLDLPRLMAERINTYTEMLNQGEQLNAIGDYASLTLNNFVSNIGRDYMSNDVINDLRSKAADCNIVVDFSPTGWDVTPRRQPLLQTLQTFDEAAEIINHGRIDINKLRQLPFWNNYMRWENLVFIGLIYSSDISHCDPVCNARVKKLIDQTQSLYNN